MRVVSKGPVEGDGACIAIVGVETPLGVQARGRADVRAIIDTGAERSVVTRAIATGLHLEKEDEAPVREAFSRVTTVCDVVAVDLVFRSVSGRAREAVWTRTEQIIVVDGAMNGEFELILGADVLSAYRLVVDYPAKRWELQAE